MVVVVQSQSRVKLFATPSTTAHQVSLSSTISQSLLKFMCIESVMLSYHLILCHPLLLPSVFPSIGVFSSELVLHIRWPKYWSFTFSISPSNEYSGVISFRIDWLDCRAVQQTLKFFMVQLSHLYLTTGKPRALTVQIFVSKEMSLLFHMMSMFVIDFLPRSKHLISWLQSPSAVTVEPKKMKSVTFHCFPSICHEVMGLDAMILVF